MASPRKKAAGEELVQILILTLAMTGAGLLGLYLVFNVWLVPAKMEEAEAAARQYQELTEFLRSDHMQTLRAQAKEKEEAGETNQPQQNIIEEQISAQGLEQQRMPAHRTQRDGSQLQQVVLNAAPMERILRFVLAVQKAKKTIEVQKVDFRQPRRGRVADGLAGYTATIDFVDYSPPQLE